MKTFTSRIARLFRGIVATFSVATSTTQAFAVVPPPMSASEIAAADRASGSLHLRGTLHEQEKFLDGAKGITRSSGPGLRAITGSPIYPSVDDELLHQDYCYSNSIVLARAGESVSAANAAKTNIFTRTDFEILELIKPSTELQVGTYMNIVRTGGEVWDEGEKIRVLNLSAPAYTPGQLYILLVRKPASGTSDYFPQERNLLVQDGKIRLPHGKWESFENGSNYLDFVQELGRVARLAACS